MCTEESHFDRMGHISAVCIATSSIPISSVDSYFINKSAVDIYFINTNSSKIESDSYEWYT